MRRTCKGAISIHSQPRLRTKRWHTLCVRRWNGFFITQAAAQETDILARCIASEEDARSRGALRLSGDFHLHIANATSHQTLGRILRELVSRTWLILMTYSSCHNLMPTGSRCHCQEHRRLLNAMRHWHAA